ncbi:MAG: hypothetical protein EOO07_14415 [Chitinophagaceae bacterium]|nr:MAG: hypothetical protein EOO07_14415 [Chitinophagaceae bacterium]
MYIKNVEIRRIVNIYLILLASLWFFRSIYLIRQGFLRSYYLSYDYYFSGGYVQTSNHKIESHSKLIGVLGANINYRYYYNLDKRVAKNKKIDNNSANYIGLDVASVFPKLTDKTNQYDYQIMVTPNWGLQRNASVFVNGEFAIGPSLVINPYETALGIGLKAGFSFRF